jgi:hypothetical protein
VARRRFTLTSVQAQQRVKSADRTAHEPADAPSSLDYGNHGLAHLLQCKVARKCFSLSLLLTSIVLSGFAAAASEPNSTIIRKALACSKPETLLRIRELTWSGDRNAGQRLGLDSVARGDCILLESRTHVFQESFSDTDICVRPVGQTKCVWVSPSVLVKR